MVAAIDTDSDSNSAPSYQEFDVEDPASQRWMRKPIEKPVASENDVREILRKPGMLNPCAPAFAVCSLMRELTKRGLFATETFVKGVVERFVVASAPFGVPKEELNLRSAMSYDQAVIDAQHCIELMCAQHAKRVLELVDDFKVEEAVELILSECEKNYHESADMTVEMVEDVMYEMVTLKKSEERNELSKRAWEFVSKKPIEYVKGGGFRFAYELHSDDHDKACKLLAEELSIDKSQFHRSLMLYRVMSTTLEDCNLLVNQMLDLHSRNELPLYDHSRAVSRVLQFGPNFAPYSSGYFLKDEATWKIKTKRLFDHLVMAIAANAAADAFRMAESERKRSLDEPQAKHPLPNPKRKRCPDEPSTRSLRSQSKKLRSGTSY